MRNIDWRVSLAILGAGAAALMAGLCIGVFALARSYPQGGPVSTTPTPAPLTSPATAQAE